MTIPLAPGGLTIEDLADLPEDGHRYELFDGSLLVSPPATFRHAVAAQRLTNMLVARAPESMLVIATGAGMGIRGNTYCVPDILVVRADATTEGYSLDPADVLLAVEVLAPSSRGTDLVFKRHVYAAAGIPAYWILDREAGQLTVLSLEPGSTEYAVEAEVSAGTVFSATHPFPTDVDPGTVC